MTNKRRVLSFKEFKEICNDHNITCMKEILSRFSNYCMFKETTKDGKCSSEVGVNIREGNFKNEN